MEWEFLTQYQKLSQMQYPNAQPTLEWLQVIGEKFFVV
jgi:hypothetical protein